MHNDVRGVVVYKAVPIAVYRFRVHTSAYMQGLTAMARRPLLVPPGAWGSRSAEQCLQFTDDSRELYGTDPMEPTSHAQFLRDAPMCRLFVPRGHGPSAAYLALLAACDGGFSLGDNVDAGVLMFDAELHTATVYLFTVPPACHVMLVDVYDATDNHTYALAAAVRNYTEISGNPAASPRHNPFILLEQPATQTVTRQDIDQVLTDAVALQRVGAVHTPDVAEVRAAAVTALQTNAPSAATVTNAAPRAGPPPPPPPPPGGQNGLPGAAPRAGPPPPPPGSQSGLPGAAPRAGPPAPASAADTSLSPSSPAPDTDDSESRVAQTQLRDAKGNGDQVTTNRTALDTTDIAAEVAKQARQRELRVAANKAGETPKEITPDSAQTKARQQKERFAAVVIDDVSSISIGTTALDGAQIDAFKRLRAESLRIVRAAADNLDELATAWHAIGDVQDRRATDAREAYGRAQKLFTDAKGWYKRIERLPIVSRKLEDFRMSMSELTGILTQAAIRMRTILKARTSIVSDTPHSANPA